MHVASSHTHLPPMKALKPGGGRGGGGGGGGGMRVVHMRISTPVTCSNVGSEYAVCIWGYLYNKTLLGARCIVFRLGIIGVMKRIISSMIRIIDSMRRIIGKNFENTRIE